ncbi:MAG: hypothetical protein ACOCVR_00035 [Myxococcota bacterium]
MRRISKLTIVLVLAAGGVHAQTVPERLIPYRGTLELNGNPVSGSYDLKFEIYSSATEGDCDIIPRPAACLWQETLEGVPVAEGQFSVMLGAGSSPLSDQIFENPELYLGIQVALSGESYQRLGGRQRLVAVPSAAVADTGREFKVTGALFAGSAELRGGVEVAGEARVHGRLTVHTHGSFSIEPVGVMRASQITAEDFTGVLNNLVTGGVRVYCVENSASTTDCVRWGDGMCSGGNTAVCGDAVGCQSGSTLQPFSEGRCLSTSLNDHNAHCYHYLCVRQ